MVRSDVGHPIQEAPEAAYEVFRYSSGQESTLGLLFDSAGADWRFLAFTLEDQAQARKVYAETRIPAGTYRLALRTEGGFHERYAKKFPGLHRGMIWVQDVPGFQWVLWHIGNDDDDTAGCLLVADQAVQNITQRGQILSSADAYRRIYPGIVDRILAGPTYVRYVDADGARLTA